MNSPGEKLHVFDGWVFGHFLQSECDILHILAECKPHLIFVRLLKGTIVIKTDLFELFEMAILID
jgi:hypothetical protein